MTEYREIPDEPGVRVRADGGSVQSRRRRGRHGGLDDDWRELTIYQTNQGRWAVRLKRGQSRRMYLVSWLVLCAFAGPPPDDKPYVWHADGDPDNCAADNLRWSAGPQRLT